MVALDDLLLIFLSTFYITIININIEAYRIMSWNLRSEHYGDSSPVFLCPILNFGNADFLKLNFEIWTSNRHPQMGHVSGCVLSLLFFKFSSSYFFTPLRQFTFCFQEEITASVFKGVFSIFYIFWLLLEQLARWGFFVLWILLFSFTAQENPMEFSFNS